MPGRLAVAAALISVALASPPAWAGAERVRTIPTRPGVELIHAVLPPRGKPHAAAILFAGGSGNLGLWKKGTLGRGRNFLIRSRRRFADHGFLTVSIGLPSDRKRDKLNGFRDTSAHTRDIAALVRHIRKTTGLPVWLVATSAGTLSAAYAAGRFEPGFIDGLVLTSTLTEARGWRTVTVRDASLARIAAPTLIVHHRYDECGVTPAYGIGRIKSALSRAKPVEVMMFEGGEASRSGECGPLSAHGFLGIETRVVDAIASWIKAQAAK